LAHETFRELLLAQAGQERKGLPEAVGAFENAVLVGEPLELQAIHNHLEVQGPHLLVVLDDPFQDLLSWGGEIGKVAERSLSIREVVPLVDRLNDLFEGIPLPFLKPRAEAEDVSPLRDILLLGFPLRVLAIVRRVRSVSLAPSPAAGGSSTSPVAVRGLVLAVASKHALSLAHVVWVGEQEWVDRLAKILENRSLNRPLFLRLTLDRARCFVLPSRLSVAGLGLLVVLT